MLALSRRWRRIRRLGEVFAEEVEDAVSYVFGFGLGVGHSGEVFDDAQGCGYAPVVHEAVADVGVFLDVAGYVALGEDGF